MPESSNQRRSDLMCVCMRVCVCVRPDDSVAPPLPGKSDSTPKVGG